MDIILDTDYLSEFLSQYFDVGCADREKGRFQARGLISTNLARVLNNIMLASREGISRLVIASAFAFIEISRKWDNLGAGRFSVHQLYAFISQPPDWFSIAPVDNDLLPSFIDIPSNIIIDSKLQPIEWTDAIHMATVISRGDNVNNATLVTSDHRLKVILNDQGRSIL